MLRVGVIMGGVSSEYEVSLKTGREMLKALDPAKYTAVPVHITSRKELLEGAAGLDFALLALHGAYGEDGTVQEPWRRSESRIPVAGCSQAAYVWIKGWPRRSSAAKASPHPIGCAGTAWTNMPRKPCSGSVIR